MLVGHLKVLSGEEWEDKVFILEGEREYKIGRAKDTDIQLRDIKISRLHSKITVKGNKYKITDLDSKNGTYVNGEKVQTAQLSDGDQIRLGFSVLQFFIAEKGTHIIESPIERKKCALCSKVISQADIISGRAEEVNGKNYCPECVKSFAGACEGERPDLSPPPRTRQRKEEKATPPQANRSAEETSTQLSDKDEEEIDLADLIEDEDRDLTPKEE